MKKLISILLLMCCCVFSSCKSANEEQVGRVSFTVLNGLNSTPIENVKIVLPEDNIELVSDSEGKTDFCDIKVSYDDRYCVSQEYGTFSVFAFKDGYCDYALFYAKIKPDEDRKIKIFLFEENSPIANGAPIAIVESPDEEWTENYIEKYK